MSIRECYYAPFRAQDMVLGIYLHRCQLFIRRAISRAHADATYLNLLL